jgi:hypothetical protein
MADTYWEMMTSNAPDLEERLNYSDGPWLTPLKQLWIDGAIDEPTFLRAWTAADLHASTRLGELQAEMDANGGSLDCGDIDLNAEVSDLIAGIVGAEMWTDAQPEPDDSDIMDGLENLLEARRGG